MSVAMSELKQIAQLTVGIVFALSSFSKAQDFTRFVYAIVDFEMFPTRLAYVIGMMLLPAEGFIALSHLTGLWIGPGSILCIVTLIGFFIAISVNLVRGRGILCYCF